MVKFFSWILVFCFVLYLVGTIILIPINEKIIGPFLFVLFIIALISSICLLITVIRERIKDRKEENKDDFSKY
ncbi:hypothetical protein [Caloranaerobacter ferrireducens]|uniref:hypothetical protein n=1 Tax=Caloranaerobacter ferrireducens TaxID=1323370 RepID=UPI00084DFAB4|nr:hypothetical protein [Caloranaerobacter ferrireducens]